MTPSISNQSLKEAIGCTEIIRFDIEPVPKPAIKGGRFGKYYPKRYREWMVACRPLIDSQVLPGRPRLGPFSILFEVVCRRPLSKPKRWYPILGDCDNFSKTFCDMLTERRYWEDDAHVIDLRVTKRYANPGEKPHCVAYITQLTQPEGEWLR